MKHAIFYLSIVLSCYAQKSNAQPPNWYVNAFNYQYSMTFTAFLNVNGASLTSSKDKVAAFVGDELRGVSNVVYEQSLNKYLVYLSVYANTSNETITFKIYNSSTDSVTETSQTYSFSIDGNVGGFFQSYSIASPSLSNQALFNTFSFLGVDSISSDITSNSINILLPQDTDLSSLTPSFSTSSNSRVYIEYTQQTSGITSNDFQNPITYKVLSEDQSVLSEYEVSVSLSTSSSTGNSSGNASGILSSVEEGDNTGVRLTASNADNHGNIGNNAMDLSYQSSSSSSAGATGFSSTALGNNTTSSGYVSTAMGFGSAATGSASTAIGFNTTATGSSATALGAYTVASDYGSLAIGQYNASGATVTNSGTAFNSANTAFVIGNGTFGNTSDAFKVLFNGDATVSNDLTVSGDVTISSDVRLKANIVSLGATLAKLLLIDGKSYTMKKNGKQKIGVLAQDIQKVFPELVSEDEHQMLSVNYQGLVPVLINALKEQETKISKQEKRIERLEELLLKKE